MPNHNTQPRAAGSTRASSRCGRTLICATFCWLGLIGSVRAELPVSQRLALRYNVAGSFMLSRDQRAWLGYAQPGVLTDLQLVFRATPLLAAQVGLAGGVFFSPIGNGIVLAPTVGGSLHWALGSWPTYLALNLGAAFTGEVMRPFARAAMGIDWALSSQLCAGPVLGVDLVSQSDGPQFSTDAIYGWVGLGLAFRPTRTAPAPLRQALAKNPLPVLPPTAAAPIAELPPLPFALSREHEPVAPSSEISALIDEAVHVSHTELLAPVLFEFDSVELEPSSIAMLHEVARVLKQERKDIQQLAVIAYSDARGSAKYNLELSARRARYVRDWLVAHGVAEQRLTLDARGPVDLVEEGEQADHQQNRRVVFRVLRARLQP